MITDAKEVECFGNKSEEVRRVVDRLLDSRKDVIRVKDGLRSEYGDLKDRIATLRDNMIRDCEVAGPLFSNEESNLKISLTVSVASSPEVSYVLCGDGKVATDVVRYFFQCKEQEMSEEELRLEVIGKQYALASSAV